MGTERCREEVFRERRERRKVAIEIYYAIDDGQTETIGTVGVARATGGNWTINRVLATETEGGYQ
jgi:hypothetical protein